MTRLTGGGKQADGTDHPLLGDLYSTAHRLSPAPSLCVQQWVVPFLGQTWSLVLKHCLHASLSTGLVLGPVQDRRPGRGRTPPPQVPPAQPLSRAGSEQHTLSKGWDPSLLARDGDGWASCGLSQERGHARGSR